MDTGAAWMPFKMFCSFCILSMKYQNILCLQAETWVDKARVNAASPDHCWEVRCPWSLSPSSYHVLRPSSRGQLHSTQLRQFRCNGGRTWTVDTGLGVTMAMSMQLLANGQQVKWKQIQFSEDRVSLLLNYCLINFCLCLWLNVLMRILNQYSLV